MNAKRSVLLFLFYAGLVALPFLTRHTIPGTRVYSTTGAIVIGILIGAAWLLITWLSLRVADRLPFRRGEWLKPASAHVALLLLCALLCAVAFHVGGRVAVGGEPVPLSAALWSSGEITIIAYGGIAFVATVLASTKRTQAAELQLANAHAAAAEAKLHALRAQLQPHFLFNALNTVAMAVRRADRQEALQVVLDLSELLRTALKRTGSEMVPLAEEVDFIRQYLEIEQIRFRDRLQIDWEIEPSAQAAAVPSLILQPLVENAVRHGIGRRVKGGHVRIRIAIANDRLHIAIEDDGPGFNDGWSPGMGLSNVQNRLALHFGAAATFETSNDGRGACVRLSVPYTPLIRDAEVHAAHR